MRRRELGRDPGLTLRMAAVGGLLALLYAGLVALAVWLWRTWPPGLVVIGALVLLEWLSNRGFAERVGVEIVDERREPRLHEALDRLCALADVPRPRLGIVDSERANSFTFGARRETAVIAVTSGLLRRLDQQELEAVLAHELSHLANRDAAVMSFASVGRALGVQLYHWPTWPFAVLLLYGSSLLTLALARYREYAADRGSAIITGRPARLMSALQKLSGDGARVPRRDLRSLREVEALCIVPSGAARRFELAMDHPPLAKRLRRLSELARELGKPAS